MKEKVHNILYFTPKGTIFNSKDEESVHKACFYNKTLSEFVLKLFCYNVYGISVYHALYMTFAKFKMGY